MIHIIPQYKKLFTSLLFSSYSAESHDYSHDTEKKSESREKIIGDTWEQLNMLRTRVQTLPWNAETLPQGGVQTFPWEAETLPPTWNELLDKSAWER